MVTGGRLSFPSLCLASCGTYKFMEPHKIRWALIGLGRHAEKIGRAIHASRNGILAAVCSKNRERAEYFSKIYKTRAYTSYAKLLQDPAIDAVFIASPNHQHKEHVIRAARAKKHILCEKPLALNYQDAYLMTKAAAQNGVKFSVGFHLRHHPVHQEARKIIHSGRIGKPVFIKIDWSVGERGAQPPPRYHGHMSWRNDPKKSGGGALMARGVHMFDILRFLTGKDAKEIIALREPNHKKEVDALALAFIRFGSFTASLSTSRIIPDSINEIVVYGNRGRLRLPEPFSTDSTGRLEITTGKGKSVKTYKKKYDVYQKEIEDFGELMRGKKKISAGARDGLASVALTDAFSESVRKSKMVPIREKH